MSHKEAPPLTQEQHLFEFHVQVAIKLHLPGHSIGMGRDKNGAYFSEAMNVYWSVWLAARAAS